MLDSNTESEYWPAVTYPTGHMLAWLYDSYVTMEMKLL